MRDFRLAFRMMREVYKVANILVCDDDKDIVEAISIYLEQEGYVILKHMMVWKQSIYCAVSRWIC